MNAIIKEFRQIRYGYIALNRNLQLDAMNFADDLVLLAASEDDLQHSLYNFKLEEKNTPWKYPQRRLK
jgi:hypothetical protein